MKIGDLVFSDYDDQVTRRVGVIVDPALLDDYHGMVILVLWTDGEREPVYANNVEVVDEDR